MTPKKLFYWLIMGIVAYQLFGYVKMHTSGDVVVYKRFAKAVMENDDFVARSGSLKDVAKRVFEFQDERTALFRGADIVFTYYVIKERRLSEDGKTAYLTAEQVSRVNPEGFDTLWGEQAVRIRHGVQLVLQKNIWMVSQFQDPAMKP